MPYLHIKQFIEIKEEGDYIKNKGWISGGEYRK